MQLATLATPAKRVPQAVLLTLLLAAGGPALAADSPAASLAGVLVNMNHFPSDADKATLHGIASDESVDEDLRAIAQAIAGIQHTPQPTDQARLNGILSDESASPAEKTLAGAVLRFEHKVSVEDKAALEALAR